MGAHAAKVSLSDSNDNNSHQNWTDMIGKLLKSGLL